MSRHLSRRASVVLVALAAIAIAFPLGALAAHQFADVPDTNQFHADIDALVDSGVTSGCGGGNYCPSANVTRDQMAAFLNRLGALAPGKTPVANAKTAQTAENANLLDGYDANDLSRFGFSNTNLLVDGATETFDNLPTAVTAPMAGYILAQGNGQVYFAGLEGNDTVTCSLLVSNVVQSASVRAVDVQYSSANGVYTDQTVCATSTTAIVCAAGTYPIAYRAESVGPESKVQNTFVTAQFLPFDQAGEDLTTFCADGVGDPVILPEATNPPKEH